MLHICLVEDNVKLWDMVQQSLLEEWYMCDWYTSVEKIDAWKQARYHVFLVDVMLPWEDGISFAARLREESKVWIIMLTAKSWMHDKEAWFDSGADDYITKPFKMRELILRIDALSQRLEPTNFFKLWDIFIDRKSRCAKKWWELVHLTPTEWEVMWCLLRGKWSVCRRADLIEHVWWTDEMYGMNRSLDVSIANIRKKLWKECIDTTPWVWYQLGSGEK